MSLPTHIKLSDERKQRILDELVKLDHNEFDEELSAFQSERILEFFLKSLGAPVYNQAIADARAFVARKMEDLDAEFYEPDEDPK